MIAADEILEDAARTFRERNAVYGNNYLNVGSLFCALFPKTLVLSNEKDYIRFHLLMLAVVKLTRYCNNWDEGGHQDSIRDMAVYSAMVESIDALEPAELASMGYAMGEPNERAHNTAPKVSEASLKQLQELMTTMPTDTLSLPMILGKYRDLGRQLLVELEDDDDLPF